MASCNLEQLTEPFSSLCLGKKDTSFVSRVAGRYLQSRWQPVALSRKAVDRHILGVATIAAHFVAVVSVECFFIDMKNRTWSYKTIKQASGSAIMAMHSKLPFTSFIESKMD